MKSTQCDKVLEYMRKFGSINKFEALEDIRYQIELVESEIADCEGYLLELRSIDGDDE